MEAAGRIKTKNWDRYDTRNVVYETRGLSANELKSGYDWAYREFYTWRSIARASSHHATLKHSIKHLFYSAGWKKFERMWNTVIRMQQLAHTRPLLEAVLSKVTGRQRPTGLRLPPFGEGLPAPTDQYASTR